MRLLQPYVDRANVALATPVRERKSATFEAFAEIWERDMNVHRRRKMTELLQGLGIPQAGFHAFRHFNVALMDALRFH